MLQSHFDDLIQNRIDQKTKPPGALGQLEAVAFQLAKIQSSSEGVFVPHIDISKPCVIVFAGDHGIAQQGVSIAPSAVTQQMVMNFLAGGAAINCFCRANDIDFNVVDCGMLAPVADQSGQLQLSRLGQGTEDFSVQAAMSLTQVKQGIAAGSEIVSAKIAAGTNLLMFGEMGIGNTSSASALLSVTASLDVEQCVGLGTGISDEQLARKIQLVRRGVERCNSNDLEVLLSEVGGFEIVHMVGAFIEASRQRVPVLVDGFIVSVAALIAVKMEPQVRDYLFFAHASQEYAHRYVLELLNAKPLLDLSLRLGEGTGAAVAYPLLKCAAEFYNSMASFDSAGVTV
ncbi:nicotinate-nucleotide--dimethylbenzimidazole phosphoribosyltransferase [Vibrio hangzhouensis]|uniref:Nicotinate-nucleotide--dimethylbenzimidazole phosphoribosyltransferase n=1 Tax=Vibrio hangzhouensis TaxID=462991 RepID=A0A1H5VUU9_9VIBR|nr:nicotinate-nucleotide--dimethylbenzimidazole phosphoribosyltransferase [Vibrio hangzhouensis]SEF91052.1 nicotinate-nucleotide-dimethylbenzimidazole phosphoribosyltransferase [Vibrio hangzhouensis]